MIFTTMHDPARNLQGQHGPRCAPCSGYGKVIIVRPGGPGPAGPTRCQPCEGTGVDRFAVMQASMSQLERLLAESEKKAIARERRIRRLEKLLKQPPKGKNSRQMWSELIAWATADGTAIHTTTTESVIFPNVTLPGGYMADGRALDIRAYGKLSTTATPTMTWAFRWGGVTGTLLATTEAVTMGSGVTNVNWTLSDVTVQTRSNGATGTLLVSGILHVHSAAGTVLTNVFGVSGFDAPAAVTVDLTADTAFSITADWSASSASNTLTGMQYWIKSEN